MKVSWFSAGVSSAVATKLSKPDLIIYNHVDDQHPDTMRFISDCEKWFGQKVIITQSPYKNVENACRMAACITIPGTVTPCTKFLKIRERKLWEMKNPGRHTYVWGLDMDEVARMDSKIESMPGYDHEFPLKDLSKEDCHGLLKSAGINRPTMYDLGFPNNNCIGCVRGGMGYWNLIRKLFPEVFASRVKLERLLGHSIIKGVYLDELKEDRGHRQEPILEECGVFCQIKQIEITPPAGKADKEAQ